MLQHLEALDEKLFLFLNGKHTPFIDPIMYWASNQFIWIPLYLYLGILFYRRFGKAAYYYYFCVLVLEIASDQVSSHLIKNTVCRLRPSHVAALQDLIHLSPAGPGGLYGFVSGHATNSFALAVFFALTLPPAFRRLKWLLFAWASLISYSRIYNGVHYPGDVLGGMAVGTVMAFLTMWFFQHFIGAYLIFVRKFWGKANY